MLAIQVFLYLQVLDFFTTLIGFRLGASEASPFIMKMIHATNPVVGVAASKLVALAIGGICLATHRGRLIGWINYWYAGLIIWNMSIILVAEGRIPGLGQ